MERVVADHPELTDKVAVVAGATRGAGRGIAVSLGEAGATVYCTGRSVHGSLATPGRPETIEETAELVTERGGRGIAVRVDHTRPDEVSALFERVASEQGHLDILVNDVWGGDVLTGWGKRLWEHSLQDGLTMLERAVHSHVITSHHGLPLMLERSGLVVEVTDGDHYGYRGNFFYDLVKTSVIRMAFSLAKDLRKTNVTALAITPGFLRSERMLEHFGVTEENWRDGAEKDPDWLHSETPHYVGRAIVALAADPNVHDKTGRVFSSWGLARDYGFTDVDGRRPHWNEHFEKAYGEPVPVCDDAFYRFWERGPMEIAFPDF